MVREIQAPVENAEPLELEDNTEPLPADSGGPIFWAALLFSTFWVAGIGAYLVGLVGTQRLLALSIEQYSLIGAVIIVPVVLTILIAALAREARSLRRQSQSLAIVAAQLAEPEEHAGRNLARLGRAIRRELDSFNSAVESATTRMATLETATGERLAMIERTALAAQERVDRATSKLGTEREKLAQFTQALDSVVLAASETLTNKLQEARAAARTASESLHAEHGAIAGLISTLQSASHSVSTKAMETGKEIERQAQRLDAASEAATARSEQVVARHERQRAALADTIDRLKQENDHMARALDYQRDGMNKLVSSMADENKKIGTFTMEGARRLDDTAAKMAQRIIETTQLFSREAEKLRTSTDLTTSGLEQAMQTIRSAGDNSFDSAGRLGSVLIGLRDTATSASQQIEGTVTRLSKMLHDLPAETASQTKNLRAILDQQAHAMSDLTTRVSAAFDRVQAIELTRQQPPLQLVAPAPAVLPAQPQPPHSLLQHHRPQPHQLPLQPRVQPQPPAPTHPVYERRTNDAPQVQGHHPGAARFNPGTGVPDFNVPPRPTMDANEIAQQSGRHFAPPQAEQSEPSRGWFGLTKRAVRQPVDGPDPTGQDRGSWDMRSLLEAVETDETDPRPPMGRSLQTPGLSPMFERQEPDPRPKHPVERAPNHLPARSAPAPQGRPLQQHVQAPAPRAPSSNSGRGDATPPAHTSSRHMIETLQAMAIDLSRFLEDDPPLDLLRRYRNGERNVFARRLASVLGAEHARLIARKYQEDSEFRDTVDRYIQQFEALLEQTARSDRENVLVETYLTSQTGKVYVTLASAIGRLS